MTFDYEFDYENDAVYFAYCIPYTFTMQTNFIRELTQNQKELSQGKPKIQ